MAVIASLTSVATPCHGCLYSACACGTKKGTARCIATSEACLVQIEDRLEVVVDSEVSLLLPVRESTLLVSQCSNDVKICGVRSDTVFDWSMRWIDSIAYVRCFTHLCVPHHGCWPLSCVDTVRCGVA